MHPAQYSYVAISPVDPYAGGCSAQRHHHSVTGGHISHASLCISTIVKVVQTKDFHVGFVEILLHTLEHVAETPVATWVVLANLCSL